MTKNQDDDGTPLLTKQDVVADNSLFSAASGAPVLTRCFFPQSYGTLLDIRRGIAGIAQERIGKSTENTSRVLWFRENALTLSFRAHHEMSAQGPPKI